MNSTSHPEKTLWTQETSKQERNIIKSPETDLHKYTQLIFDTEAKAIQWGKDYSTNGAITTGHTHVKIN